ncbi:MAG: phage DNA encapsidation protein [Methanobrevibacter sp.]|nr:phage DNA encapsidation protein [Methanobrevibacter sp.]
MEEYYSGTRLLSMKDINGNTPELYLVTTNRTGGKTVWFSNFCLDQFRKGNGKFALIYRYNYELDNVADKFFKDIGKLFYPNYGMRSERKANGIFHELYLYKNSDTSMQGVSCGYAISLNSADMIKKYAHFFSDTNRMLFDEFQSETNHYCADEVKKLISIHTSIARGQGEQVRYVPVYMLSNPVSIINPYYVELGISERLREDTKFLRGDGFVLEQGYVESASKAQKESAFNRAFSRNSYIAYSSECVYLNDNKAFIEKPTGSSRYLCTLRYNGTDYGIREFPEVGFVYCDDKPDMTYRNRISVTTEDHNVNYVMLRRNELFIANLRYYFEHGAFRFKNLKCKEAVLKALSY